MDPEWRGPLPLSPDRKGVVTTKGKSRREATSNEYPIQLPLFWDDHTTSLRTPSTPAPAPPSRVVIRLRKPCSFPMQDNSFVMEACLNEIERSFWRRPEAANTPQAQEPPRLSHHGTCRR